MASKSSIGMYGSSGISQGVNNNIGAAERTVESAGCTAESAAASDENVVRSSKLVETRAVEMFLLSMVK